MITPKSALLIASLLIAPTAGWTAFIEPVGRKDLSYPGVSSGFSSIAQAQGTIAFGSSKAFIVTMNTNPADATKLDYYVTQYDYNTGLWSRHLAATSGMAAGNSGHNSPEILRDAQGYLEIFYGANDCFYRDAKRDGPCYKKSLRPDDPTAWGQEQEVPLPGMDEGAGFYSANGYAHFQTFTSQTLAHYKRDPSGTWTSAALMSSPFGNNDQAPSWGDFKVIGSTLHRVWCVYQPPFSGGCDSAYYMRSTDNGETWTNINGTTSFTRLQGLRHVSPCNASPPYPAIRTEAPCQFPEAYRVASGPTSVLGQRVEALPDGTVVATFFNGYTNDFRVWTGTKWESRPITGAGSLANPSMEILSTGAVVIYAVSYQDGNFYEFVTADKGLTWQKTSLGNFGYIRQTNALRVAPAGQRERVLVVALTADPGTGAKGFSFWDRPFGAVGTTPPPPPPAPVPPPPAPVPPPPPSAGTGPLAHWRFDETAGTSAADSSGNGNAAFVSGAAWVAGKINNALSFDGVDDSAAVSHTAGLNTPSALTVSAWINNRAPACNCSTAAYDAILSKGGHPFGAGGSWSLLWMAKDIGYEPSLIFAARKSDNTGYNAASFPYSKKNAWTHVAGVFNNGSLSLYEDGVLRAGPISLGTSQMASNTEPVTVASAPGLRYFNGLIDDAQIFNRALSASEIQSLFAAGQAPPPASSTDLNGDGSTSVTDVQIGINQTLGGSPCATGDVNHDGVCNIVDVQQIINAALGL